LNISLLNSDIVNICPDYPVFKNFNPGSPVKQNINKKEERQKKSGEIDSCLKSTIFNRCIAFILRCVNMHELTGPGSGFPIRVITWSFNAKGNMVLIETNKKVSFKEYTQMEPAAAGLLFNFLPQSSQRSQRDDRGGNTDDRGQKTDERRQSPAQRREMAL
jgi:hypothetical protein